ncbi:MAG: hypothetical protein U1E36_05045 [Rickettsiales bacterium]
MQKHFFISMCVLALLAACSAGNAPTPRPAAPEVVCAKQGLTIGTPEFNQCVAREKGYRQLETIRKENDKQELYRDFDRARRF